MRYIEGSNRGQALLLPARIEDYVAADAAVRVIDAFVDGLDLVGVGFSRATPALTGRPGYDRGDLLKLYVWGYSNEVRSSRRLERACRRDVEAMWLMCRLAPDFKTIADFRAVTMALRSCAHAVPSCSCAGMPACSQPGLWPWTDRSSAPSPAPRKSSTAKIS